MLRDRVPSWALEVCCPRGIESPEPLFCSGASLAPCSSGDRRSPGAPIALVPLGYRVTTNPQPLPYYLYEGRCIRCPGLTLWQSTSLKRTRRSSRVSLEVLERSTKGEQIRN